MARGIRSHLVRVVIATLAVVLAGLAWWFETPDPPPPFQPTNLTPKHTPAADPDLTIDRILLITLDTLRADHLSSYGYMRQTSPFLDQLARQGARFTNAFAHMPTTVPSHSSIFTGLYPLQHHVRKNGHILDEKFVTLAEMFRSQGFTTAGFVSTRAQFLQAKLDQGFDHYDQPSRRPGIGSVLQTAKSFGITRLRYRIGHRTVSKATEWLESLDSGSRFFMWVHLFDPHYPLNRQNVYALDDAAERQQLLDFKLREQKVNLGFVGGSEEAFLDVMQSYDGEIRAVDRYVQTLVEALIEQKFMENLLIIVTSDHGEALGDHNFLGHGMNLYNEMTRVPLILFFSSGAFSGKTYSQVVRHVDLLPTMAELAKFAPEQVLPLQGKSLLPILEGSEDGSISRSAFSQRRHYVGREETADTDENVSEDWAGEKFSLFDGRYKYVYRTEGDDELYFLERDPYETTNLIGKGLAAEEQLREQLLSLLSEIPVGEGSAQIVDDETIKELEALGYVQ